MRVIWDGGSCRDREVVGDLAGNVGIYRDGCGDERCKEIERNEKIEVSGLESGWVKERRVGEYEERMKGIRIEGGGGEKEERDRKKVRRKGRERAKERARERDREKERKRVRERE